MKTIINDIKDNRLKQAYLLYGDEAYLINDYKNKLLNAMTQDGDTSENAMNFTRFEGKDTSEKEVISIADTLPFFDDYRTIYIKDTGWFKSAKKSDDGSDEKASGAAGSLLCEYIKAGIPETTRFVFVESKVDKRSRLFKAVKDAGNAVEFGVQPDNILGMWIKKNLSKDNMKMSDASIFYFLSKTGNDMSTIKSEYDKLISYCMNKEMITNEDIDAIVTRALTDHIFGMLEAIGLKNQKLALSLYSELLALKEPPMKILALLTRQFNMLLQIKELRTKGYSKPDMASKMDIKPFVIDKYLQQAARFDIAFLKQALNDCVTTDENVKTGKMVDRLGVELLIVKYSAG